MPPSWQLLAAVVLTGCGELRERPAAQACTSCHGSAEHDDGRPPPDLLGSDDTTGRGVGAHAAHLDSPNLEKPLACDDCHVVPETVFASGHLDLLAEDTDTPADVTVAGWQAAELRCSDTACHARSGAAHKAPLWTQVDESQIGCDGCHGAPPPAPHPDATLACVRCHPGVNDASDGFDDFSRHLDGTVDVTPVDECASCHGRASDGAPPPDLDGHTETMFRGVGAHLAHLEPAQATAVACTACHVVPEDVDAKGHLDAAPADVAFAGLAMANGVSPAWDATSLECSNTYCHGATLAGGTGVPPVWTDPTDDFRACDSCHGYPPPTPHAQWDRCDACHTQFPIGHVDGDTLVGSDVADVNALACDSCHGDLLANGNAAPPADLDGGTATTSPGVGAHQSHLGAGVACTECHTVPVLATDAGHLDTDPPPAEVVLARGGNYDFVSNTCSGTDCHGTATPNWTIVDGSQATCGSCHDLPPGPPHTTWNECTACHAAFPAGHVDGAIDVAALDAMPCDACHGSAASAAPPVDLAGSSLVTQRGVGAHGTHVSGGVGSAPVDCAECHVVPVLATDAGHLDTGPPADVAFGTLASAAGSVPSWDGTACAGVYCHTSGGNAGGTIPLPIWTTVDGSQSACGTCHDLPPPSHAAYPSPATCESCHATAVGGSPPAIVQPLLHINGLLD